MAIVAGIDCGTQSTKVVCYDSISKEIIAKATSSHKLISKEDGTREQMASWYIDAIKDCFSQIPSETKFLIEGIGVSGQQHGFVALDENKEVIVPVKLWCDTSTSAQCNEITEKVGGEDKVFELIQNQILPGYTASKILYLKQNNKEAYDKLAHILLPHDYINFYLTNNITMEEGDTSGTALFDVKNRCWSKEILKAIDSERDLSTCLPRIIKPNEIQGFVRESVAKELGLNYEVIVSCGGGDNMIGAIGCGCTHEGSLVMSMGTSGTLFGYSEKVVSDRRSRLAAFISSSGGYLPLLCTMNCTVVSEQIRNLLKIDVKELDILASKAEVGSNGISILPYFNGERVPNYPNGEATIFGMNSANTSRENISRAALESGVFAMKIGLDAFVELGFKAKELILIGGGANSKIWSQMVSDIFNLPVTIPTIQESAAFGGAIQVLSLIEKITIDECAINHCGQNIKASFSPVEENYEKYKKAYGKYLKYDKALSPLFK
ncbi:MAG: xylulokinase [Pleomorphochaeta sp.]